MLRAMKTAPRPTPPADPKPAKQHGATAWPTALAAGPPGAPAPDCPSWLGSLPPALRFADFGRPSL